MTAQTILPANSVTASFDVANALRFEPGDTENLVRDPSSSGNRRTFTISFWMKFSEVATTTRNIITSNTAGNDYFMIRMEDHQLQVLAYNNGTKALAFNTSALYRDPSSWHHVVVAVDTTQGTEGNRFKMYVNGTQITSFSNDDYPSQNVEVQWNHTENHFIGCFTEGTHVYKGYLCEIVNIDGAQLEPTSFGEFDSDSPTIWKPKNPGGLTFGTNGFYLNIPGPSTGQNANGMGGDSSGNGHHFGSSGLAADSRVTDTCTNNYATLNSLNVPTSNAPTFAQGNLKTTSGTTGQAYMGSATIGVSSGKWYAEMKVKVIDSMIAGVSANVAEDARDSVYPGQQGYSAGILPDTGNKYINDSGSTHGDAFSANDILMIALDLDNNNVYFGRNGNWFDGSGNADESSPNSAISLTAAASTTDGFYFFSVGDGGGSAAADAEWNFGNAPYSISSGNADADGHGNFEYAVPSGYFALNTKNLAEYG